MQNPLLQNIHTLEHYYLPDKLPTRESDLTEIKGDIKQFFSVNAPRFDSWLIHGPIGSGKTVLSRKIAEDLKKEFEGLREVYVNCRNERRVYNVLASMVTSLEPSLPKKGFSRTDLFNLYFSILEEEGIYNLLILDEIDALFYSSEIQRTNQFLYQLSRVWDQRKLNESKVVLIIVTRDISKLYTWLDDATRTSLIKKAKKLSRYSFSDLVKILDYRATVAFGKDAYDPEAIEMIAKHVSSSLSGNMRGNARIAIDLLRDSAFIAASRNADSITPNDVRKAISRNPNTEPIDDEIFLSLGKHRLLLLLAIARAFKKNEGAYITRRQVSELYNIICEEYGEKPRGTTQVIKYLKNIEEESKGAVSLVVSGKGQRGRSTRIILNIPPEDLEAKVTKLLEHYFM